jgi:hypothetical protein
MTFCGVVFDILSDINTAKPTTPVQMMMSVESDAG